MTVWDWTITVNVFTCLALCVNQYLLDHRIRRVNRRLNAERPALERAGRPLPEQVATDC